MNNMKEIKLGDNIKVYVSGGNHKEETEKDLSDLVMNKFKCVLKENNKRDSVNINNTFHVDKPKGGVSCDDKGTYKMKVKEQPNEERIIRDKMEQFKKGDKIKIVQGNFKALKDKECTFLEYCKTLNKVLIQLDEINSLYVNPLDIKLIKKCRKEYTRSIYNEIDNKYEYITIIEDEHLATDKDYIRTIILKDGTTFTGLVKDKTIEDMYYQTKLKQCDNFIKTKSNKIKKEEK